MHLVEVLVATALFASAMTTLPVVFALGARSNLGAAETTWATVLAAQKIEELRSRLLLEPTSAPEIEVLDGGYVRSSRVEPLAATSTQAVVLTVVVSRHRQDAADRMDGTPGRAVRLVTVRTRPGP